MRGCSGWRKAVRVPESQEGLRMSGVEISRKPRVRGGGCLARAVARLTCRRRSRGACPARTPLRRGSHIVAAPSARAASSPPCQALCGSSVVQVHPEHLSQVRQL